MRVAIPFIDLLGDKEVLVRACIKGLEGRRRRRRRSGDRSTMRLRVVLMFGIFIVVFWNYKLDDRGDLRAACDVPSGRAIYVKDVQRRASVLQTADPQAHSH